MQNSFCDKGNLFQSLIQAYYLRPKRKIPIDKIQSITIEEISFSYSCSEIIEDLKCSRKNQICKAYHFFQACHWAFDSLIYDGSTKNLIFIQITVNENHNVFYNTLETLLLKDEIELKEMKNKSYHEKFFSFLLQSKIAENYYYLWITDKPKEKILMDIKNFNESWRKKRKIHESSGEKKKLILLHELEEVHKIVKGDSRKN